MGIIVGVGLMSTATDVIYTHKKFKRPAVEVWESGKTEDNLIKRDDASSNSKVSENELQVFRNPNTVLLENSVDLYNEKNTSLVTESSTNESKFSCAVCGFVNGNKYVFQQHGCINNKNRRTEMCRFCRQSFALHSVCKNNECIASRESHSSNNAITNELVSSSKIAYNRSSSYPLSPLTYIDRKELSFDNAKWTSKEITHTPIPAQIEKQIYKPKFRAQYSFSEETVKETLHNQTNKSELLCANRPIPTQEKISYASNVSSTYHAHTASSVFSTPANSDASSLSPRSYNQIRQSVSASNIPNAKFDEFQSLQRGIPTPCSSIWKGIKGIKSPSPELVNQHITNLIVQNQAIVETHNPLWSIKYRRQSSTSSLNDDNGAKARRSSVSEYAKGYKGKIQSVLSVSQNKLIENPDSSSLSCLPKSNHTPTSFSRASKQNISVLLPTSSNESKVRNIENPTHKFKTLHSVEINDSTAVAAQSETLNLTKYSVNKNSNSLLSCQKCGSIFSSNEINEHVCKYIRSPHSQSFSYDQDVALDLQKKQEKILEYERSSSRESCFSEPIYKQNEDEHKTVRGLSISPSLNLHNASFIASPPVKRRKLSINDFSSKEMPLCSSIFSKNGKISSTDYGIKMLEDLNKPKSNSNHIFGGEVKICDGNEYKTLKIDSIKNETPSLDLCIASRRLNEETEGKEVLLPTSVVLTIAKCGLNSGGTMVKVENKSSYHNKNRHLNINENLCTVNKSTKSSQCLNDNSLFSTIGISVSSVNNPQLLQYPQIKPHPVSSLPPLTASNLSQGGFSLHLLPPGITLHTKSNLTSPLSLPVSTSCHGIAREQSNLKHKESSDHYFPTIISIGDEKVPYVPGIPGPYSQTGLVFKCPTKPVDSSFLPLKSWNSSIVQVKNHPEKHISAAHNVQSQIISQSHSSLGHGKIDNDEDNGLCLLEKKDVKSHTTIPIINDRNQDSIVALKPSQVLALPNNERPGVIVPKNLEITVQPLSLNHSINGKNEDKVTINRDVKLPTNDDEKTFLMPRQRPNTLLIKQQSFNPKSSLALIGSTLVSPDTPRPRKSCAQLLLNGSAYTYLNLKVSTKTFFCCIYRPQPMYVLQSTNPKLSMYSNWQIRKSEDPLNLSPIEAMSLHISGHYYNRCYTIAKPKTTQLIVTPSSYWTLKKNKNDKFFSRNGTVGNDINLSEAQNLLSDSKSISEKRNIQVGNGVDESEPKLKRVKIFEGGFKTNEDYIYVRGRGRGRYVCETCGIRCKKPSMLKKHIRTHTDLRPFACKHCSFSFKTKGNLTKHLKSKAHFKRCTEMGIIPVPITVDDSHINQEALQLQGILEAEHGKDNLLSNEDGDEEDEDEGDDDEADEDDEEDEEDEDDEDIHMSPHGPSYSVGEESVSFSSYVSSVKCSYLNPSTQCESIGVPSPSVSLDKHFEEAFDNSINNAPIDLSVRRPTVIASSDEGGHVENNVRPNILKLNKRLSEGIFKYPNCSLIHVDSMAKSAPQIKEQVAEILSPVTDSSLLLQSIYNSTSSLEKHRLKPDVIKDGVSCGNMLNTYLKEIAVQDSARKRYQYLNSSSKEYPSNCHQTVNIQLGSVDYGIPVTGISMNTNTASINTLSLAKSNGGSSLSCDVIVNSCSVVCSTSSTLTSTSSHVADINLLRNLEGKSSMEVSTDNVNEVCTSSVPENISSNVFPKSGNSAVKIGSLIVSNNTLTSSSTYIVASKVMVANNFPSMRSHSVKTTRSTSSGSSTMPTPPANLTVINSCEGDSKPAFIAPSGVIPSTSARMGSDDGKCKCSICQKEFAKQSQLRLHMNIHFIERPHRCDSCGVSFRTNGHLQKHKRSVSHFNKVNMNMTFGTPSTDNPRPFKCHDCKIAFRIHGHLAKHLRSKLHIMKLECLGKLPFGTYAEIERSGVNLNEIDTSDCENSLESLQAMASKLYEKDPAKLVAWQSQQLQQSQQIKAKEARQNRERSISNSSTNSEDYLLDEQDVAMNMKYNDDDESGEEEDNGETETFQGTPPSTQLSSPSSSLGREIQSPPSPSSSLPSYEVGSGATEGLLGCPQCHQKFLDVKHFELHYCNEHEKKNDNN